MSKIKKVDGMPKFPELENEITSFWKDNGIFQKSVDQRSADNSYSFVDGPPFVTGVPHYGTLLPSIAKDVVPRYWTMKGKRVRRVFGWDCHGLPIEEKVNKKFGIKSSVQLESEMGVDKYVQECRNWVNSCSDDWGWYIDKIGRWVDMDNAYYTMNTSYMESVIWAFKNIHDKGLIYKGKRVSMYSTDTGTPVSQFEVAMDNDNYRDIKDLSIFVKFKLLDNPFASLLPENIPVYMMAWTTTPWTIPSNFGLAVNPKESYVLVQFEGIFYVLAEKRLEHTFKTTAENIGEGDNGLLVKILKRVDGNTLEGLKYEPVYDYFVEQTNEKDYHVYLYDGVTIEDGTGVLHLAPAFGEEDFNLGKLHGLSAIADIDDAGLMLVGESKGQYLRDASPLITENLVVKGNLFRSEMHSHRVPFYRGENPLIYMAQSAYFIDIQKIKARMLELNQEINWTPDFIKEGRFAQTIETSPDWCISRNRYWATIMPVWESEDGDQIVVGSLEEMTHFTDQVLKVEGDKTEYYFVVDTKRYHEMVQSNQNISTTDTSLLVPMDLHRDVCDKIIFNKDGKEYHRIPEVLDCWMDSGAVPFAEHHYPFENREQFEGAFPSDYIIEYVGQVRAWFNVLLRLSTILFDAPAFTNVICTGVLAGNDGRKMSKSFGNYPDPKDVLNNVGGEALRLYMMGSPIMVGGDMNWSDELLNEQVKNIMIPIWNTYKYLTIYTDVHDWTPVHSNYTSTNVLDKWLQSYMNKVTLDYSKALESYNLPESVKLIQPAIDNISTWWIRRSRDRFASGDIDAVQTLYAALVQFIKTFAPQMAFVTEELYQKLVVGVLADAKESVHLEDYPSVSEADFDKTLLVEMDLVRRVSSLGQNVRVMNALKVRQPLSKAFITLSGNHALSAELAEIVKEELNVIEVEIVSTLPVGEKLLTKTEGELSVTLDTNLTPELKAAGLLAELKRQLQNLRKTSGLQMGELVTAKIKLDNAELRMIIDNSLDEIKKDISIANIEFVDSVEGSPIKVGDVEGNVLLEK